MATTETAKPVPGTKKGGPPTTPAPDTLNEGAATNANVTGLTYTFIASWLVVISLLILISKTRIGYVLIYYGLLLIIFGILVTEYKQVAPLLNPPTISELEASS